MNISIHYIKVSTRNIARHKIFSFINIIGLSFGMLVCLNLIMLVTDHMMFDQYNTKRDRIYRVYRDNRPSTSDKATVPLPIRNELLEKYTGVDKVVRFKGGFGNDIGNVLMEKTSIPVAGLFADAEVFEVFEYELEYGNPKTALIEPFTVVLKKSAAKKLFRQENPVGETLTVGELGSYKVTGVIKETDRRSHIEFEALASMASVKSLEAARTSLDPAGLSKPELENWDSGNNSWVYILLEEGKHINDIQTSLDEISEKHYMSSNSSHPKWSFYLQNLIAITPGIPKANEIGPVLHWGIIYFFGGIALAILATSCFNFTNLSIARSLGRVREIGVRKVTGASRWQIFTQFMIESIVMSLLSLVLATILMFSIKPYLVNLNLARMAQIDLTANFYVWLFFILFAIIVGILAGLFPAVILSGLQPVKVLKNLNNLKVLSKIGMRRILVISQFSIALIFIISTIAVYKQLDLFIHINHGFDMENNIVIELNKTSSEKLKNELNKYSNVENISAASHVPATFIRYWNKFKRANEEKDWKDIVYFSVDEDYLQNIQVPIMVGRFFSPEALNSNRNHAVINEEAVKSFHYSSPLEAIGEVIVDGRDSTKLEIIGVVKNYNSTQLTQSIQPMVLLYIPEQFNVLQVKYSGSYVDATKSIDSAWAKVNPGTKAGYSSLHNEVLKFYDLMFGDLIKLLGAIAFCAITICCLGLLGIVFYSMETRMKEISIRKIVGASNSSLVFLLSKSFASLFLASTLVGIPIAYTINNFWLENVAYHIVLSSGVTISGVAILGLLAALVIFSQTFRATQIKPVDNLKIE